MPICIKKLITQLTRYKGLLPRSSLNEAVTNGMVPYPRRKVEKPAAAWSEVECRSASRDLLPIANVESAEAES
jgi:hypothetical protein